MHNGVVLNDDFTFTLQTDLKLGSIIMVTNHLNFIIGLFRDAFNSSDCIFVAWIDGLISE
jgi:hypothetical protein